MPISSARKVAGLVERLETAESTVRALLAERAQERVRTDRAQAVAGERNRMIDALRGELTQVCKDKDAEIARLVPKAKSVRWQGCAAVRIAA